MGLQYLDVSSRSGIWRYRLDESGLVYGQVTGSCECGNETSGYIKFGELLDYLIKCYVQNKDILLYYCIWLSCIKLLRVTQKLRKFNMCNKQGRVNQHFYITLGLGNHCSLNTKERITGIKKFYYNI